MFKGYKGLFVDNFSESNSNLIDPNEIYYTCLKPGDIPSVKERKNIDKVIKGINDLNTLEEKDGSGLNTLGEKDNNKESSKTTEEILEATAQEWVEDLGYSIVFDSDLVPIAGQQSLLKDEYFSLDFEIINHEHFSEK